MPRFYFHLFDDAHVFDNEGVELPDVATARQVAVESAREVLAAEMIDKGTITLRHWIEVEDEERQPVLTVPFRAAVKIEE